MRRDTWIGLGLLLSGVTSNWSSESARRLPWSNSITYFSFYWSNRRPMIHGAEESDSGCYSCLTKTKIHSLTYWEPKQLVCVRVISVQEKREESRGGKNKNGGESWICSIYRVNCLKSSSDIVLRAPQVKIGFSLVHSKSKLTHCETLWKLQATDPPADVAGS